MTDVFDDTHERAVLGAALIRPEALDIMSERLVPTDFRRAAHQQIFSAMLALSRRRVTVDLLTVKDELSRSDALDDVGGPAYIASLTDILPRAANYETYVQTIKDQSLLRKLHVFGRRVADDAEGGRMLGGDLLDRAESELFAMGRATTAYEWVPAQALAAEVAALVDRSGSRGGVLGVQSGLKDLDQVTRGFHKGDMTILGARPSVGKTALALQIATHVAQEAAVAFFSVEMDLPPLGLRLVASRGNVDHFRMMSGYLSDMEYHRVAHGLSELEASKLYFQGDPYISPVSLRSKLRRLRAQVGDLALVVVDYLQLLAPFPDDRSETRATKVGNMSRALKLLAREFDVPFLVLSQLNRAIERAGGDHRPTLSDLRESGAIEQDADAVLLLHRPSLYDAAAAANLTELIVAKQRNGPVGTITLTFHGNQMRFSDPHETTD